MKKYNLGCGNKIKPDFINIDKYDTFKPDIVMDLECDKWNIESNSADYILLNHVLEHVGQKSDIFLNIMKELYRISKNNTIIEINVPHPLHIHFRTDPTHVRMITGETLSMFSKKNCNNWTKLGVANTPFATILDVDFEIIQNQYIIDNNTINLLTEKGIITKDDNILDYINIFNNLVKEIRLKLKVIK